MVRMLFRKKLPIEKGVPAKLYILAYEKPKSKYRLSMDLYGAERKHAKDTVTKLAEGGYLIPVENEEWQDPKWIANTKPIVKEIQRRKEKDRDPLTDRELEIIDEIISADQFRKYVGSNISEDFAQKRINGLEAIIIVLDLYMILVDDYRDMDRNGMILHDEEIEKDKETFLKMYKKELKNMKSIPPWLKRSSESFGAIYYDADNYEKIPDQLIEKIKGISKAGKMFLKAMEYAEILSNAAKEVEEKYSVDKVEKE